MNFYDNHIHSNFSPDSKIELGDILTTAINNNLSGISITDHYDIDAPCKKTEFLFDPNKRNNAIDNLINNTNIKVFKGIEIGLQTHNLDKIKNFVSSYYFDVVIGSTHFIDGVDPYFGEFYIGKSYKEAYGRTLETIYQTAVGYKDFDILGHFDYIARYSPYTQKEKNITLKEFGDYLDPILKFLAHNGKLLEVNTKSYIEHNGFTPILDINILKRLKELGADAVSLGSDSHDLTRLGSNFEQYAQIIKECGFKYLGYFENRKPHFYKIY